MRTVPLTQGLTALVDDEDYDRLIRLRWYPQRAKQGTCYAKGYDTVARTFHYMHRLVMNAGPGQYVDHRNHDGLDNRRSNLRVCTNQQNCANQRKRRGSSQYKGVSWSKKFNVWVAMLHADYGGKFLGHFKDEEDAARAYDAAARARYGEFARTNF